MRIYLSLGTNLGDKEQNLRLAIQKIEERVGKIVSLSAFHTTAPWGFSSENSFLNAACCVEPDSRLLSLPADASAEKTAFAVLYTTQQIERELGRTHKTQNRIYHDRLIDIDLLLAFDSEGRDINIGTPELTIPHPLMHERDFVMVPLREILPAAATKNHG